MAAPQNPYPPPYTGYGAIDPDAPYGRDPVTGRPLSDKSASSAGVLQLFLGWFGVGRIYIGSQPIGFIQLGLGVLGFFMFFVGLFVFGLTWILAWPLWLVSTIWAFVDAIMIFTGAVPDGQGRKLR